MWMQQIVSLISWQALRIQKRKIIGGEFIEVFAEEARKLDGIEFLAQGTIWPDILESEDGIKAHHNAGGLPEDMNFELVEPVRILFKDEVRAVCSIDVMTATVAKDFLLYNDVGLCIIMDKVK